jgi:hypothetical protein
MDTIFTLDKRDFSGLSAAEGKVVSDIAGSRLSRCREGTALAVP